jgi:hypothetical protein
MRMAHLKKLLPCLLILLTLISPSNAVDRAHYRELSQRFGELAKQKDWQGARAVLAEIGRELPAPTPRYFLIVASVEMHLGHKAEALQWLQKYAATGLSYDIAKDDDLKPLLADEAGQKLAAKMKERSQPIKKAEFVCTLPQADTMPEDITYLKAENKFIVSSIQHHTLYRVELPKPGSKECTIQELPLSEEAKRWPTLAVSVDPKRNVLWMTAFSHAGFQWLSQRR